MIFFMASSPPSGGNRSAMQADLHRPAAHDESSDAGPKSVENANFTWTT
jgi:hypothetical protein